MGKTFDSIGERDRYLVLLEDQRLGKIHNLQRQVKFPLTCNGVTVCHYIADFVYDEIWPNGYQNMVVEDFKGVLTDTFQLKAKWFKAQYGFDITITRRGGRKNVKKAKRK